MIIGCDNKERAVFAAVLALSFLRAAPLFADNTNRGFLFSIAAQYCLPTDVRVNQPFDTPLPGARLNAGYALFNGEMNIYLTAETGFTCFKTGAADGYSINEGLIWVFPLVFKALYSIPLMNSGFYITPGYFIGAGIFAMEGATGVAPLLGGRLYVHIKIKNNFFIFAGGGVDMLVEKYGGFVFPLFEAGIRL